MTAICLAVLAALALYFGVVGAAFATLMRLSLRLVAERDSGSSRLGVYLDDPVRLFLPVRAWLGAVHIAVTLCFVWAFGLANAASWLAVAFSTAAFILVCEHLVPYFVVRRNPERVLEALLPSFVAMARLAWPIVAPVRAILSRRRERPASASPEATEEAQQDATAAYLDAGEQEGIIERDERQLLQSVVDFGDTLVREVMTPRPDIVAISPVGSSAIRSDGLLMSARATGPFSSHHLTEYGDRLLPFLTFPLF